MGKSPDPAAHARQLRNLRGQGNGSSPAAPVGNQFGTRHGGYGRLAAAHVDAKVRELMTALGDDLPVREADGSVPRADAVVLRLLAEALLRLESVTDFLNRRGFEDDQGHIRPAVDVEARLRGQVLDLCQQMGLTPKSRLALGIQLVAGLSAAEALQDHLERTYGQEGAS